MLLCWFSVFVYVITSLPVLLAVNVVFLSSRLSITVRSVWGLRSRTSLWFLTLDHRISGCRRPTASARPAVRHTVHNVHKVHSTFTRDRSVGQGGPTLFEFVKTDKKFKVWNVFTLSHDGSSWLQFDRSPEKRTPLNKWSERGLVFEGEMSSTWWGCGCLQLYTDVSRPSSQTVFITMAEYLGFTTAQDTCWESWEETRCRSLGAFCCWWCSNQEADTKCCRWRSSVSDCRTDDSGPGVWRICLRTRFHVRNGKIWWRSWTRLPVPGRDPWKPRLWQHDCPAAPGRARVLLLPCQVLFLPEKQNEKCCGQCFWKLRCDGERWSESPKVSVYVPRWFVRCSKDLKTVFLPHVEERGLSLGSTMV